MSLRVEEGGRELLRVEVLEARADGTAKFRLWYYNWRETRPDKPYVDIEIKSYQYKDGRVSFMGRVYANKRKGILREHLAEIAQLLKHRGVEGVAYYDHGRKGASLQFTGAFRDLVLSKLGIEPELPPGEPPAVQHLGGLRFKIGDREVEFARGYVKGGYEFYAKLEFPSREEAERFASSLGAIGVYAEVRENMVRLDSDAFFGVLAAADAVPPGLAPLYRSEEGDFRVYASAGEGRMRFYFAVKRGDVWRAVEGLYTEKDGTVQLWRKEREVLEAIKDAVAKALKAEVGEPKELRDEKGNVEVYYLKLRGPLITAFLEHAADRVEAKPADVRLEGRRIVVKSGEVDVAVEFKLLKGSKVEFLLAHDVGQTLALYKSLKEAGVRVEITPKGVKINSEALWALVAAAVERGAPGKLPAEVMPGVELLKVHSAGGLKLYILRAEGVHYYFAVKAGREWRVAGGKYRNRKGLVLIAGKAAPTIADVINTLYREMGVERRVEVKYNKDGTPYIQLTNVDLRLLGLIRHGS